MFSQEITIPVLKILLLEDNPFDVELISAHLTEGNIQFDLVIVESEMQFLSALNRDSFDVILADYSLPAFDGIAALKMTQTHFPDIPFIFVSGTVGEDFAIETLKLGATDYVLKQRLSRLIPAIERALKEASSRREKKQAKQELLLLKNELAEQLEDITRLQQLSSRLLNTLELNLVFDEVLRAIAALQNTDMAVLMLFDSKQNDLYIAGSIGLSTEYLEIMHRMPLGVGDCGTAVSDHRAVMINNLAAEPMFKSYLFAAQIGGYKAVYSLPLFTRNGEVFGAIATYFRDNYYPTERKIRLVELYAVQAGWAIDNARLYDEAQQANRLKDEFLSTISHELRTPLTSIWGWAQLLCLNSFDDATLKRALETIETNTRNLVTIVEDILDVSKIIQGQLILNVYQFELPIIIDSIISNLTTAAKAKNIDLFSTIAPEIKYISGDPERLQQVIWNLVSNAIKFTPEQGKIEIKLFLIETNSLSKYVQIEVVDTGIGIKRDQLPYIFDRFRQADGTLKRGHGGLGLGLAIVRHLIELHGGTVYANSEGEGKGSRFVIKLPMNN
jgi:signal transduction histidine kinase/CheY-like chemotaxis protein